MINTSSPPWWEITPEEEPILLAFIKIDRVGSTSEWEDIPQSDVMRRAERYTARIEQIARDFDAAQPLNWQGDGVMLFLHDAEDPAPVRAWLAAREIWNRVYIELNLGIRIAVHCVRVPWQAETGKIRHHDVDLCGHLEQACPPNAITATEDVYLALPDAERAQFAPLGITARDKIPAFVFPVAAARKKDQSRFEDSQDLSIWRAFRTYAQSPEIRRLRYVGFRLTRKEPPSLDVEEVFIPPKVQIRGGMGRMPAISILEAGKLFDMQQLITHKGEKSPPSSKELPWTFSERAPLPSPPEPFRQAFMRGRSLIVLGEPGAGKTTLLRWLAVVAAGGKWKMGSTLGVEERLLPLPVSVGHLANLRRQLGQNVSVLTALAHYFQSRNLPTGTDELIRFLQDCLEGGECLVLMDGLDEVETSQRLSVVQWLETFAAQYPGNRFIASSRRVGYVPIRLPEAQEALLLPFEPDQVESYLTCFTRAYSRWETGIPDETKGMNLLDALRQNPRLSAIARNPFMLSALALIHRAEGSLPRHRVMVYEIFARALCETWGSARRLVTSEVKAEIRYEEEALPILGALAVPMHEKYPSGAAPEEFVLKKLAEGLKGRGVSEEEAKRSASEFLKRAGEEVQILFERGHKEWGFLHLTFQEFFAAAGLLAQERFEDEAMKRLFDPRWEEIIRLGVGIMALIQKRPEATRRFIEKVLDHRIEGEQAWITGILKKQVPLAALLAAEAGDALPPATQNEVAKEFVQWVLEMPRGLWGKAASELSLSDFSARVSGPLLEVLIKHGAPVAASALGALGVMEAVPRLLEILGDKKADWQRRNAATAAIGNLAALGKLEARDAVPILLEALGNEIADWEFRASAAEALGALGAREAVSILQKIIDRENVDRVLRYSAAVALGAMGVREVVPSRLEILSDKNAHWELRYAAVEVLGAMGAREAIPLLLEILGDKNAHWELRYAAAQALVDTRGIREAVPLLLEALSDENTHWELRYAAAVALGAMGVREAVPLLLKILDGGSADWQLRYAAIEALGDMGTREAVPFLLETLRDHGIYSIFSRSILRSLWRISSYIESESQAASPTWDE